MNDGIPSQPPPDVLGPAETLATILREDKSALDKETFRRGEQILTIFQDSNFGRSTRGLNETRVDIVQQAILDMADRGKILSKSFLGVTFLKNQVQTFVCDYGESPEGNVVYKIGLKDVVAFRNWRQGQNDDINQDDINAAIYRLAAEWASFL